MSDSKRPVIGLTPDAGTTQARPGRPSIPRYELKQAYCDAVIAAGGVPIALPYVDDLASIASMVSLCAGIVVTGGAFDIPPDLYGEKARASLGTLHPVRTSFELRVLREALSRGLPVLGVCGGMQLLAVELGGTLFQDIREQVPNALEHEQPHDSREPDHAIQIEPESLLAKATNARELRVNTTHHQAVHATGRAKATARSSDGVIEAIEGPGKFVLGVQWHPELMLPLHRDQLGIYRALVEAAAGR